MDIILLKEDEVNHTYNIVINYTTLFKHDDKARL